MGDNHIRIFLSEKNFFKLPEPGVGVKNKGGGED